MNPGDEAHPPGARHATPRAVTFDVGGTLITPWPSVGHIYAEVAAGHGCPGLDPALLNRRFAAAWRRLKGFRHARAEWAALVDATFQGLTTCVPSRTFFPELYDRFTEPSAWHVFEDVLPALDSLAGGGFRLGIISNWDDRLRPLLRGLGLDRRFEAIVVSCEVNATKPAAEIFRRAALELGIEPAALLHVGDSLEMDVKGAQAAGCQGVLLDRAGENGRAPGQIRSLCELKSILSG